MTMDTGPESALAETVETPAVLIDLARLTHNVRTYADIARSAGVALRPHVKTHKTIEIARVQRDAGATGLTVAKLSEARVYAAAGFTDIFVAYPVIGPLKWSGAAALAASCRLTVGVDSIVGIEGLSRASQTRGSLIHIRVEFDSGLHRSGVQVGALIDMCRQVMDRPGLRLDGIFTFRSSAYDGSAGHTAVESGTAEGELLTATANHLREARLPIDSVSGGSTPTAGPVAAASGVTEIRPGTYVFQDRMTVADGVTADDVALSVLTTVVSRPSEDMAIVDAGSKTLAADVWPASAGLRGFAEVVGGRGYVEWANEEHGAVRLAGDYRPRVGDALRLIPNHVCTVVNLSRELLVVDGARIVDSWNVAAGLCRT